MRRTRDATHLTTRFSWSNTGNIYMKRETIMTKACSLAPHHLGNSFIPQHIEWYKRVIPTVREGVTSEQIHVSRSFKEALRSLLTNVTLINKKNLLFPNKETPSSYENNPPIANETIISEFGEFSCYFSSERFSPFVRPLVILVCQSAIDKI